MVAVVGGAGVAVLMKAVPPAEDGEAKTPAGDDIVTENYGCAFNIAAKLAQAGVEVSFATVLGNDMIGLAAVEQLKREGVDTDHAISADGATPMKVEMINVLGDPEFLRVNQRMYERITPEVAAEWGELFRRAEAIVLDGALPRETIEYLADKYGGKGGKPIFFDPADAEGGLKAVNVLDKLHCIMPGRIEAEAMTKLTILSEEQLREAGRFFSEKGVGRTFITMKGGGLYYKEGEKEGILRPERVLSFARTTGAGDVTSAAIVAESLAGRSIEETAAYAMAQAAEFLAQRNDERFV